MRHHTDTSPGFSAFRRLLAAGCAALVLALGAMAVNPALHALAHAEASACGHDHHHEPAPADSSADTHVCAVTLFGQGLTLVAAVTILRAAATAWSEFVPSAVAALVRSAPRSRHAPPCGPPLV